MSISGGIGTTYKQSVLFRYSFGYPGLFSLLLTTLPQAVKENPFLISIRQIDHFTVVCSVTWPLNGGVVGGDLALIQFSAFFPLIP